MSDKVVVDTQGHTLRADAAASYTRMIAAGMPKGGIDVFERSFDEQKALYARYKKYGSPIAARPSLTAPHIKNVALDFQTTRNGKYDPSEAFLWITKGTVGSKAPRDTNDAKMRGHEYGWYRSVPSERWHIQYDPKKDKHRAADLAARLKFLGYKNVKEFQKANGLVDDGVDGPKTWAKLLVNPKPKEKPPVTPPTVPTPAPKPTERLFRFGQANWQAERFGGLDDDSPAVGEYMRDVMKCSNYALSEVSEKRRNAIRKVLGTPFVTYPINYVANMWTTDSWAHTPKTKADEVTFGTSIHGAIRTKFTDKEGSGLSMDVISIHVRPSDAFGNVSEAKMIEGKLADIEKALKNLYRKGVPTIFAGDFNTSHAEKVAFRYGLVRATPNVDTVDREGDQKLDAVFVSPEVVVRGATLMNPGNRSDHKVWVVNGTLVATH